MLHFLAPWLTYFITTCLYRLVPFTYFTFSQWVWMRTEVKPRDLGCGGRVGSKETSMSWPYTVSACLIVTNSSPSLYPTSCQVPWSFLQGGIYIPALNCGYHHVTCFGQQNTSRQEANSGVACAWTRPSWGFPGQLASPCRAKPCKAQSASANSLTMAVFPATELWGAL